MSHNPTPAAPPTEGVLRRIPIARLHESSTNPRTRFDQRKLEELAESIETSGVLAALLVRESSDPDHGGDAFEIIDGARRFRAAQMAGLVEVPCVVRDMNDAEVRRAQLITGLQSDELHPLDEADGYRALMAMDPVYTVDRVAADIGKSKKYVYDRLKLGALVPAAKEAFASEQITAGHAILIARLTPDDQAKALEQGCFEDDWSHPAKGVTSVKPRKRLVSVRDLDEWIGEECRLNLDDQESLDPDVAAAVKQAAETGAKLLEVSTSFDRPKDVPTGVLHHAKYREVGQHGAGARCEFARKAIVVHGDDRRGEVIEVCATKKCPIHFPPPPPKEASKPAPKRSTWEEEQAKRREREKVLEAIRPLVWAQLVEKTKKVKTTNETLERLALDSIGHDKDAKKQILSAVGPITAANLARAQILADEYYRLTSSYHIDKLAKEYGIDVKKLEAEHAKQAAKKVDDQVAAKVDQVKAKARGKRAPAAPVKGKKASKKR